MNLGNLRTLSRLTIPGAKISRIKNTNLDIIINIVVKDINARLRLLNQDDKFEVTASQYKYDLGDSSETVTRFFKIDNLGLYWNAGSDSSTDWRRIFPKTVKWLDINFPQWRDASSSDPLYYAKKGRYLYIYPTPDTTLMNGFWLYFLENTVSMSSNNDWPFGNATEISEYSFLAKTIIKGVEAWVLPIVGKKQEGQTAFQVYLGMIEDSRKILNTNLDITSDKESRMKIKHVC